MYVIEVFERNINNNALDLRGIFTKTYNRRINGDPLIFVGYDELNEKYANPYTAVFKTKKGAEKRIEKLLELSKEIPFLNDYEFYIKELNIQEETLLMKSVKNNNIEKINIPKNYIILNKENLQDLEEGKKLLITIDGSRYIMLVR